MGKLIVDFQFNAIEKKTQTQPTQQSTPKSNVDQ